MRRSFALTAISDWVQCLLLLSGTLSFLPRVFKSQGRMRAFWTLLAMGMAFWFCYQLMWTYFEIILRTDVPDLCAGDIILFLHIVPFMAALALRPDGPQDEYAPRLRQFDFVLMMTWWMYLYIFAVMAWQYVVPNIGAYDDNLNLLYLIEKLAFLGGLVVAWLHSKGAWKTFYANLFGASLTYAFSSYVANWAISRHAYYSGSLYDIPLCASMAWITVIGLWCGASEPEVRKKAVASSQGMWLARVGMIAVFSLPLLGGWALLENGIPSRIRSFRLVLTLGAALCMGVMVFVRQRLLDRELLRLLTQSRESLANLKRLQAQITESEKHASVGQLVGGAAHELNNPITAMMGYSDLLLTSTLNEEQKGLATKIVQHVRRARLLVATLLSFAKQGPATMAPVDLKTVLRTAAKISAPMYQSLNVELRTSLQTEIPAVLADSNQLLQMCVQVLNSAATAGGLRGVHQLVLTAEHNAGLVTISICPNGLALDQSQGTPKADEVSENGSSSELFSRLGLTACQNILSQHRGRISCSESEPGLRIKVELPVIPQEQSSAKAATAVWQPQSSA
ncbi:MAG TPA: HAMP domain-containing sensor histidine kinase [Candidatus Sulfotelmatobacter sp.]